MFYSEPYEIWYSTEKRGEKRKGFQTLKEAEKWLKLNHKKIKICSGASWQIFDMIEALKNKELFK